MIFNYLTVFDDLSSKILGWVLPAMGVVSFTIMVIMISVYWIGGKFATESVAKKKCISNVVWCVVCFIGVMLTYSICLGLKVIVYQ